MFDRVAIAGVGLIGGSLALACKRAGVFGSVIGLGRGMENLKTALRLSIVDEITSDIEVAAKGADLFFAATPVETIPSIVLKAAEHLPDGCVITDGGSVKGDIVAKLDERLRPELHFVGSHPVAGTEKTGASAAFRELYQGRYTILTPTKRTNQEALLKVSNMWKAAGSKVVEMSPEAHDATLALISHLPHLLSFSLMDAVMSSDPDGGKRRFAAGGLKDTTRIAAGDPAMWRDIFSMNKIALLDSLQYFQASLDDFRKMIEAEDFDSVQERIGRIRRARNGMDNPDE